MKTKNFPDDHPIHWKYQSSASPGLHTVVSPENSPCKVTWIFRLNLSKGQSQEVSNPDLEQSVAVISGKVEVEHHNSKDHLSKFDSFYLPGEDKAKITAMEDSVIFIGAGPWEGEGTYFVRPFDSELPLGEIRQIHGKPPYERHVFMCVNQEVPGSRLITGITYGNDGGWTSWPPHQHSKDLEEVYCYFDIPSPKFALHLSSRNAGEVEAAHPVSTGDCVIVPEGYHPTVGIPGSKSCYFWVMSAFNRKSRRYDLAVNDPNFG